MTRHIFATAMAALVFVFLGAVAPLGYAQAANCFRWDESDAMRCFDCMKIVWDGHGYHRINTCPPRHFAPKW